jgi:hypothetical protein
VKKGALKAACMLNVKDGSLNTGAAGKGYLRACASCNTGSHLSSAENSLRCDMSACFAGPGFSVLPSLWT